MSHLPVVHSGLPDSGRNETVRDNLTDWARHHDRYDAGGSVDLHGRYVAEQAQPGCCTKRELLEPPS